MSWFELLDGVNSDEIGKAVKPITEWKTELKKEKVFYHFSETVTTDEYSDLFEFCSYFTHSYWLNSVVISLSVIG